MRFLLILCLMILPYLQANNDKQISLLDFVELLSVHNNINIFIDENTTKEISFFVPEDVQPKDYFDIFQMSMKKDGFNVLKKGDIYYLEKIPILQTYSYFIDLKYNSFDDVSKYLKFKNIAFEYISSTNRFLISAPNTLITTLAKDIKNIDVPKKQVSLKFSIIEISDNNIQDIGLDLTSSTSSNDVKSVLNAIISPQTTSKLVFQNNHFYSVLKLYNENKKLNVTQNPFILVQDGKEFDFKAVTNIPYKFSETNTQSAINTQQTQMQYKDVGLKINGTPFINKDFVNLDLNLSIEDILSIVDNIPTTYKRSLKSNTNLKKGEVLILSGIKQTKVKDFDFSIPYISSIPYLGDIFKYKSKNSEISHISIAVELVDDS